MGVRHSLSPHLGRAAAGPRKTTLGIPREEPRRSLAGEWLGAGEGSYAGVPTFRCREHLTLTLEPGWSMLSVLQRTWRADGEGADAALHLEAGVLRTRDDDTQVFGCGPDSGRIDAMTGTATREAGRLRIDWVTIAHGNDDRLLRMGRTWWVGAHDFHYEAHLATVRTPAYRKHLVAELRRRDRG